MRMLTVDLDKSSMDHLLDFKEMEAEGKYDKLIKLLADKISAYTVKKIKGNKGEIELETNLHKLLDYNQLHVECEKYHTKAILLEEEMKEKNVHIHDLQRKIDETIPYSQKEKEYFPSEMRCINLVNLKEFITEIIHGKYIEKRKATEYIVFESDLEEANRKNEAQYKELDLLRKEIIEKDKKMAAYESTIVSV